MFLKLRGQKKRNSSARRTATLWLLGFLFLVPYAYAADIVVSPLQGSHAQGETFTVSIYVDKNTEPINAVSGTLTFPANLLSVRSISKDGSIIKLWAEEPTYSNQNGSVHFEGVVLNPGFSGTKGKVLSVTFIAKNEGVPTISFQDGQILANDGSATNVVGTLGGATYTITPQAAQPMPQKEPVSAPVKSSQAVLAVTSASYPDQNAWYNVRAASFSWAVPATVNAVRLLASALPNDEPTKVYSPPVTEKTFTVDKDGVYYFHAQAKDQEGWGPVVNYKYQVDTVPPLISELSFADQKNGAADRTIKLTGRDELSGLSSVRLRVDSSPDQTYPISPQNTYDVTSVLPGDHVLTITLVDNAGNASSSTLPMSVTEIKAPTILDYTKQAASGGKLTVTGTTYPHATVEVRYANSDTGESAIASGPADDQGRFSIVSSPKLPGGTYEMKARVIGLLGRDGTETAPYSVTIAASNAWLYILVAALLLLVLGILGAAAYFFRKKGKPPVPPIPDISPQAAASTAPVDDKLKNQVAVFKREVQGLYDMLEQTEKTRALTVEESVMKINLKKRLSLISQELEQ